MKNQILLLCFCLCSMGILNAQVTESKVMMSMGNNNAYSVDLDGADFNKAEKVWKEYMKSYGKFDKDRKKKEFRAHELRIPSVDSGTKYAVTLKLDEGKNMTTAHVFFQEGERYINSDDDTEISENIEAFVVNYQYEVQRVVMREMLEDEEKSLKNLMKSLSKLEGKNEDLHNDIEKYEKKIVEAESDIVQNLKDQDEKSYEIEQQQKKLEKLTEEMNAIGKN